MLQCRITGNNDGQNFVRTYYTHIVISMGEFRGAATLDHLVEAFPSPDSLIRIQMGDFGVKFDSENLVKFELSIEKNGQVERFTEPVTLLAGNTATLVIGELHFNVEVKDFFGEDTGSDFDEESTIYENSDMVVTRRGVGIQVTRKQDPSCSIHIKSSDQFYDRLNVIPSDSTGVRLTHAKDRPVVQFLPGKQL
jgi:hypothetical protein